MSPNASLLYCGKHDALANPQEEGPRETGAGPRHTQTGTASHAGQHLAEGAGGVGQGCTPGAPERGYARDTPEAGQVRTEDVSQAHHDSQLRESEPDLVPALGADAAHTLRMRSSNRETLGPVEVGLLMASGIHSPGRSALWGRGGTGLGAEWGGTDLALGWAPGGALVPADAQQSLQLGQLAGSQWVGATSS
ncbi:hypothetical protein EI555_014783 [Monodon monoceros]|uniref:Uncharacterized protein n=1 Tax=Monodon monoceros TaxID=40151 RepID=A0A4U1FQE8_MONMO|nr:hypothetical protein EI555_014783 [Monodon monoceros]